MMGCCQLVVSTGWILQFWVGRDTVICADGTNKRDDVATGDALCMYDFFSVYTVLMSGIGFATLLCAFM